MIEINWNPSRGELRVFGVGLGIFAGVLCGLGRIYWNWPTPLLAVVAILGFVALLLGVFQPPLLRPIYLAWMIAVFPIGYVVSHVILALVYYGFITPIGCCLRLTGYDPLQKKKKQKDETYWSPRQTERKPESYFRQY